MIGCRFTPINMKPTLIRTTCRRKRTTTILLRTSLSINFFLFLFIFYLTNNNIWDQAYSTVRKSVWHGGHPAEDRIGSCWCGKQDGYCMCTPNLAIDLIITSSSSSSGGEIHEDNHQQTVPTIEDYVWLVRRKDTNQLATMGGFVEMDETVEDAVKRELMEEMALSLNAAPKLVGLYSDPRRDNRRRTASVVFAVHLSTQNMHPHAGDDAKEVVKIPFSSIENHDFFSDHRTILLDYRATLTRKVVEDWTTEGDFAVDIQRSTCVT